MVSNFSTDSFIYYSNNMGRRRSCDCRQAGAAPKQIAGIASSPESLRAEADRIEGVGYTPCDKRNRTKHFGKCSKCITLAV